MQSLVVSVKEKGGKPDRKPNPLPYGLRNSNINLSLRTLKIMPGNLNVTARSRIRLECNATTT
jgi:hypothetical protein